MLNWRSPGAQDGAVSTPLSESIVDKSDLDRLEDLAESQRFREHMPNKSKDPRIENRKVHKERKMWRQQKELLRRTWG